MSNRPCAELAPHAARNECRTLGYPFASVDSTDIARNHNRKNNPREMAEIWDGIQCSPFWDRKYVQAELLCAA